MVTRSLALRLSEPQRRLASIWDAVNAGALSDGPDSLCLVGLHHTGHTVTCREEAGSWFVQLDGHEWPASQWRARYPRLLAEMGYNGGAK